MSVRLSTLGPPRCFVNDSPTDLAAQKLRFALLLYLSVEKRVARESVAAMFWPERDEERARHALSQTIYELRRVLGDEWLKAQADPLEVTDTINVDALDFETLMMRGEMEQALEVYNGQFLDGFHLRGSNEFESWVESKRRDLHRLHHRACRHHIATLVGAGKLPQALSLAHRWAEIDRLDDEANHAFIDVLARCGRRAEAIAHFEAYEKRIRAELDVAPLDQTRTLVARIREAGHGPPLAGAPTLTAPPPAAPADAAYVPLLTLTWWEELKHSRVAKTAAVYGASTFVVIQFADVMVPALNLPPSLISIAAGLVLLGFPFAILVAWLFGDPNASAARYPPVSGTHASSDPVVLAERVRGRVLRKRAVAAIGFSIVVSTVLLYNAVMNRGLRAADGMPLDTTRYAVLPFKYDSAELGQLDEDLLIRDAISRWDGVTIVEPFQVREAIDRLDDEGIDTRTAALVARENGAGRYVLGQITSVGDSLRIYAVVYDATRKRPASITSHAVRAGRAEKDIDRHLVRIAEYLLIPANAKAADFDAGTTNSVPARRAFGDGMAAIKTWDLALADSQFSAALRADGEYAQARLWVAQVRSWQRAPAGSWRFLAHRALTDSARLSRWDGALARALDRIAEGDLPEACNIYRALTEAKPHDFVPWYSLADCLSRDKAVIRDEKSPSGWAFRSSYHSAVRAYQRAFELLPSTYKAFQRDAYYRLQMLLVTRQSAPRDGRSLPPDTTPFLAHPSLAEDTLAFVPYPRANYTRLETTPRQSGVEEAVRSQRRIFHEIATSWATSFQNDAEALNALSISLELLGDAGAIDTLVRARGWATDPQVKVQLATREVLLRLKFSLPSDVSEIRRARLLADSTIEKYSRTYTEPRLLAGLCVLLGRANEAAQLMHYAARSNPPGFSDAVVAQTDPLLAFAATGGPVDSIRAYEARTRKQIESIRESSARTGVISDRVLLPALLALPVYSFDSHWNLHGVDYIFDAASRARAGDRQAALRIMADVRAARESIPVAELTIDALYPEAWLLMTMGNTRDAREWIEPKLNGLRISAPLARPGDLAEPGALVRSLALLAELAAMQGDAATARTWASAYVLVRSGADRGLQPTVARMRKLAAKK